MSSRPEAGDARGQVCVRINGGERRFPAGTLVSSLLVKLGVSTPRAAVERNREIVPKAAYDSTPLEEGDEIEVVEFVGGG